MLACDIILAVRTSRSVSADLVKSLERMVFGAGSPNREQLDLLLLIDGYALRADPSWAALLDRAVDATHVGRAETKSAIVAHAQPAYH